MSLTVQQKLAIRSIRIYKYSSQEKNGKPYYVDEKGKKREFIVPKDQEILTAMFKMIKEAVGAKKIESCEPQEANCIIRVFRALHHKHEWGAIYNLFGAECYTKVFGTWKTNGVMKAYKIYEGKCQFRMSILPDECLAVDAEYNDYYILIS